MTDKFQAARADLKHWVELQPTNFFASDVQLQRLMKRFLGESGYNRHEAHFQHFGGVVAGELDSAARINNRDGNTPKLERWSPFGERLEAIAHHPSNAVCGKAIYEDGEVIAAFSDPGSNARALALFYLSSHAGEAGHNCPVACTAGVVKALVAAGSDALKKRFLPGLLTAEYARRLDGAQFITEVQGGSDVGANAVMAQPDGHAFGTTRWKIHGEKWFCSNADADLILMTARVGGAGTGGLGLFLVPRILEDGSLNRFFIRRLKDKIGTRSMPSGEFDFDGATAYAVGDERDGFRTLMTTVINTSRVYNTVGCAGIARRACIVAAAYANARNAFGEPIIRFPLVQEMIANMRSTSQALTAGSIQLAALLDGAERGELQPAEEAYLRVGTNLAKMRSCQHSHRVVLTAIETLGGNGAIETFSVLPRLLRDNVVYENWEGTHNTLIAQTVRDFAKHSLHGGFLAIVAKQLETDDRALDHAVGPARAVIARAADALPRILSQPDPGVAALMLRPHAEQLADAMFAAAMAQDIASETDTTRRYEDAETLRWFVHRWLGNSPLLPDEEYASRARRIASLPG